MEATISRIIEKEWRMFQAVNAGLARADCQQTPETFARMRCAQFLAWNEETCRSYEQDLIHAEADNQNLLEHKYIHMMARCAPKNYEALKARLPQRTPEHKALAQKVNRCLMAEARLVRKQYPFLNRIGRPLDASGDTEMDTSVETYQLGELLTYSQQTLRSLLRHIEDLEKRGESLAMQIQLISLQALGFRSFEDAAELVARHS